MSQIGIEFLSMTITNSLLTTVQAVNVPRPYISNTTYYFKFSWFYAIPIALLIYCVLLSIFTQNEITIKIKRIYYSIVVLIFMIILKNVNLIGMCDKGMFGASSKAWSVLLFTIAVFIIAILIDVFIISGYVFSEIGILGTRLIKQETRNIVKDQKNYIRLLESGIESLFYTTNIIKDNFDNNTVDSIRAGTFDYLAEFKKILYSFFNERNLDVVLSINLYSEGNSSEINSLISELSRKHQFSTREREEVRYIIDNKISYYLIRENYHAFLINANSRYHQDKSIIIDIRYNVKPKYEEDINLHDEYIILLLYKIFELEIARIMSRS